MHSKAHFKSLFKSPEISTVEAKNIFFLNTTFPKEHLQIYFTILGAFKLKIGKSQKKSKTGSNELSFTTAVADRWDPLVRGPHASVTRNRVGGAARLTRRELDGGEFAGGDIITIRPT